MKKNKTHTIFIRGTVEELNMLQITENQFKILNKDEDDNDIRYELEEELMGDSLINGFSYSEDGPDFDIYLDDNEEPIETGGILIDTSPEGIEYSVCIKTKPKKKTYWMIGDSYSSNAEFYLKINGEFNLEKLTLSFDYCRLPDGSVRSVVTPHYDHQCFDIDGSYMSDNDIYILTSEGERF